MFGHEEIVTQPVFFLFIAFSFALSLGYFWGRRKNRRITMSAFKDLQEVVRPDDQTFTNIGGAIGYHASLIINRESPVSRIDATITLLPRHSWLYLPVSKLVRKYDRLFITLYFNRPFPEEAHLIETRHAGFGQRKIGSARHLQKEEMEWGKHVFFLYYSSMKMREAFVSFMHRNPEPGIIRHIALVPEQKKGFVFLIPREGLVHRYFAPIHAWLPSLLGESAPSGKAKRGRH